MCFVVNLYSTFHVLVHRLVLEKSVNRHLSKGVMGLYSQYEVVGSGGRTVERRTVNRGDGGSIPPTAVSKLRQFHSPHISLCLSEETLKASGPF